MAKRSTRNRLKFQGRAGYEDLEVIHEYMDKFLLHVKNVDDMADDKSEWVVDNLPRLIVAFELFEISWLKFTDGL